MRDLVAGVDSSTQSCKLVLRRLNDGALVATARAPHPPTTPPCSEQAPEAWWQALRTVLGEFAVYLPRIAAISVGGQGHGLVLLDEAGQPLRDAKLWNDTEAAPDAERLCAALPACEWAQRTGSIPAAALTVSKLAWTQRVHPELVMPEGKGGRLRYVLLPSDFLVFKLTGRAVTERGVATGTGYFNPFSNAWELELASLAVPQMATEDWLRVLPEVIDSSACSGTVCRIAGMEALAGAVVAAGTGDNMAAALGLGIERGDSVVSLGTSGTMYGLSARGICDETGGINGYADAAGGFLPMVTTLNCDKVTTAFRRLLGVTSEGFEALVLASEPSARGLVLVPYLDGERTPNLPQAAGVLHGLRSDVEPGQLARAAAEAVVCNLLEAGEHLTQHGLASDGRLILTGGGSRSQAYRQLFADLTGRPVWVCSLDETAAAGAAVQAAAALRGCSTVEVAREWRPEYRCVAEPELSPTEAQAIRHSYRAACVKAAHM